MRCADPSGEFFLLDGIPINTKPPLGLLSRIQPETLGERLKPSFSSPNFILPSLLLLTTLLRRLEVNDKEVVFSSNADNGFDGVPDGVEALGGFDLLDPAPSFVVTRLYPSGQNDSNITIRWNGASCQRIDGTVSACSSGYGSGAWPLVAILS